MRLLRVALPLGLVALVAAVLAAWTALRPGPPESGPGRERAERRATSGRTDAPERRGEVSTEAEGVPEGQAPRRDDPALVPYDDDGFPSAARAEAASDALVIPRRPTGLDARVDLLVRSLRLEPEGEGPAILRDWLEARAAANRRLTEALDEESGTGDPEDALRRHERDLRERVDELVRDLGAEVAARVLERVPCEVTDPATGRVRRLALSSGRIVTRESEVAASAD